MPMDFRKAVPADLEFIFDRLSERHSVEYGLSGLGVDGCRDLFKNYVAAYYPSFTFELDGVPCLTFGFVPMRNGLTSTFACATEAYWDSGAVGVRSLKRAIVQVYPQIGPFLTSTKPTPDARWKRWIGLLGFEHVDGDIYGYGALK